MKQINRRSWIIQRLRRLSMRWPPRNEVFKQNRRELPTKYKKDGTPFKKPSFEHQCNKCKQWFKSSEITMDHIMPVVDVNIDTNLTEEEFIGKFVIGLFCWQDNWQKLCVQCNKLKTDKENEKRVKNKQNSEKLVKNRKNLKK